MMLMKLIAVSMTFLDGNFVMNRLLKLVLGRQPGLTTEAYGGIEALWILL